MDLFFRKESLEFRFCLLCTTLIVLGFLDSFIGSVLIGPNRFSVHVVVHSLLMFGWLGVVLFQCHSISQGRVRAHRILGILSAGLVTLLIIPYGIRATFEMWAHFSTNFPNHKYEVAKFVLNPVLTLSGFCSAYFLGIAYRKKRDLHSSFMTAATVLVVSPGLERLPIYHYPFFKEIGSSNFSNVIQFLMFAGFVFLRDQKKFRLSRQYWALALLGFVFLIRITLQSNRFVVESILRILS